VLMQRTFGFDVLACPRCGGRLRLIALIEERRSSAGSSGISVCRARSPRRVPPGRRLAARGTSTDFEPATE
jgi:uncharacterized protein YbaR (Trm112 family)